MKIKEERKKERKKEMFSNFLKWLVLHHPVLKEKKVKR